MGSSGSAPNIPAPPAPAPPVVPEDDNVGDAADNERRRLRSKRGRSSTHLVDPLYPSARKDLVGE